MFVFRQVFPSGLPEYFSVIGTFNSHNHRRPWSLVRARSQTLQFSLTLLPNVRKFSVFVQNSRVVFNSPEVSIISNKSIFLFLSNFPHVIHINIYFLSDFYIELVYRKKGFDSSFAIVLIILM